jgi:hypothetical protein
VGSGGLFGEGAAAVEDEIGREGDEPDSASAAGASDEPGKTGVQDLRVFRGLFAAVGVAQDRRVHDGVRACLFEKSLDGAGRDEIEGGAGEPGRRR